MHVCYAGIMKKPKKLPRDRNQLAYEIVRLSTEEPEELSAHTETPLEEPTPERSLISEYLSTIGRKGGLKGGKVRNENLTPERRKEIAKKAALARWNKK
jgi:hypothetical protein